MGFGLKTFGQPDKDGGIKDVFGASPNFALQYDRGAITQNLCQYNLNGTTQYMTFGDILDSVLSGASPAFTIEMWVKRDTISTTQTMLGKFESTAGNQLGFEYRFKADNTLQWLQTSGGSSATIQGCTSDDAFTDTDDWHYIALTLDYTAGSYTEAVKMYYDANPLTCTATTPTKNPIFNSSAALLVGASNPTAAKFFLDGQFRNVVITDRVKTAAEIDTRFDLGNMAEPSATDLEFYVNYKTDTFVSGNWVIEDLSPNSNDGASVNMLEADRTCEDIEIVENKISGFNNSITYDTGLRSTVSEFAFNYSGTTIRLEAAVTGADNIDVYEDGVYTQSVTMVNGVSQLVTLSAGEKLVTLTESVVSNVKLNGVKLTFIIVEPSLFSKVDQGVVTNRFVFLGDSITMGQGATNRTREGFAELFRYTNGKSVTITGYSGGELAVIGGSSLADSLTWITNAFRSTLGRKVLTIMLSTNDFSLGKLASIVNGQYIALIDGIHANDPDIEVFVITPTIRTDDAALLDTYRANQVTMCSTRAWATSIDGKTILTVGELADVVHPNTAGHLLIHDAIDSIIL